MNIPTWSSTLQSTNRWQDVSAGTKAVSRLINLWNGIKTRATSCSLNPFFTWLTYRTFGLWFSGVFIFADRTSMCYDVCSVSVAAVVQALSSPLHRHIKLCQLSLRPAAAQLAVLWLPRGTRNVDSIALSWENLVSPLSVLSKQNAFQSLSCTNTRTGIHLTQPSFIQVQC